MFRLSRISRKIKVIDSPQLNLQRLLNQFIMTNRKRYIILTAAAVCLFTGWVDLMFDTCFESTLHAPHTLISTSSTSFVYCCCCYYYISFYDPLVGIRINDGGQLLMSILIWNKLKIKNLTITSFTLLLEILLTIQFHDCFFCFYFWSWSWTCG